jgi:16S rRNA (cytidine1402-2'-O)-methyltransferase
MPLFLVATPIGNKQDITLRAIEVLKSCDLVIGEEKKELDLLLRRHEIVGKPYELLNEHTKGLEIQELAKHCQSKNVALVTDCGTPGFCDPGADLVKVCRIRGIPVTSIPGPSSLMTFMSLTGRRLDNFHFDGFLPRETDERRTRLKRLLTFKTPVIIMDTPYRLKKLLGEIQELEAGKKLILGTNLTFEDEQVLEGTATDVLAKLTTEKAEFLILLLP